MNSPRDLKQRTLRSLGVPRDRIAYEFFGPATVLDTEVKPKPVAPTAGLH